MDIPQIIQNIRQMLRRPDLIPKAFQELEILLHTHFPHRQSLLTPLVAAYRKNEEDYTVARIIDREYYDREFQRILNGVEKLLETLLEEHQRLSGKGIQLGSELAVVSCNRQEILKRFWLNFEEREKENQPLHLYLLAEQKYDQADSLVKRLITDLKEGRQAVRYPGFDQIEIGELDIGDNEDLEESRFFFRRLFNKGLPAQVRSLHEFADLIDAQLPAYRPYHFVPLAFKLNMTQTAWEKNGVATLEWITQSFCRLDTSVGRTFVLFFILNVRKKTARSGLLGGLLGKKKKKPASEQDIHQALQRFSATCAEPPTVLPPLTLVDREDLLNWYKRYENNQLTREKKVDALIQKLPRGTEWPMSYVEEVLAEIVEEFQNASFGI